MFVKVMTSFVLFTFVLVHSIFAVIVLVWPKVTYSSTFGVLIVSVFSYIWVGDASVSKVPIGSVVTV